MESDLISFGHLFLENDCEQRIEARLLAVSSFSRNLEREAVFVA
jgi:hypothetical protein